MLPFCKKNAFLHDDSKRICNFAPKERLDMTKEEQEDNEYTGLSESG